LGTKLAAFPNLVTITTMLSLPYRDACDTVPHIAFGCHHSDPALSPFRAPNADFIGLAVASIF